MKTAPFTFFLLAAALSLAGRAYGQPYYFRHYQVENGLSNNAVLSIVQDRQGFIWCGTKDGLNRFDGYTFKTFRSDPGDSTSLGSNFILGLYEDPQGILWVGTENGLYRYDATTESFRRLTTPFRQAREMQMDEEGNLWFITGFALAKWDARTKKVRQYPIETYFQPVSIAVSPAGAVWVSTSGGMLEKWDAQKDAFTAYDMFTHSKPATNRWIEKILCLRNGTVLVGTANQGAKLFDPAHNSYTDILTYNPDNTEIFVRNFLEISDTECWIASESGIFIYNRLTGQILNIKKTYNDPYSLSDNAVYTFCKDREGGIWAGTYFGGVNYYPKQYTLFNKFFPRSGENSLSGNVIHEIQKDPAGHVWIGTEDAGLNRLDPATGQFTHYLPGDRNGSLSYTNIQGLLATGHELWVGTFMHGLDILDTRTGRVTGHVDAGQAGSVLQSNFITCIYQPDSTQILLGTTVGVYRCSPQQRRFLLAAELPLREWYTSLLVDASGRLWAGTYGNGIFYYDPAAKKGGHLTARETDPKSLASDRINTVFEDSNRDIWFATEGGLCRFNRKSADFTRFTTADNLPSNVVLGILEDDRKNLWISTTRGLVSFPLATHQPKIYTQSNGLLSDQFNSRSAYKDETGRMYFGSLKGLISFHPGLFIRDTFAPPVFITGFQLSDKELAIGRDHSPLTRSITFTDEVVLPYNQSTFSIDFAALSFTAPEGSEYRYKMKGLDKHWTYLKTNRKAFFTGLAPGTYTFAVKASTAGVWSTQERELRIRILPPWWFSWWACSLYALLAVLGIWWGIRYYHQWVEEKNRRKIGLMRSEKEKEFLEAKLLFFTNVAHEIKTPLTLIKGPLENVIRKAGSIAGIQNSLDIMERNTNRLITLTNELLDLRQTEINGFTLSFREENVSESLRDIFLGFMPLAEAKKLSFTIHLPPVAVWATIDGEAFSKMLTNLLSNAVKYADTTVAVRLLPVTETDRFFTIRIWNDGFLIPQEMSEKIFEPFFRLKETEEQKGMGIGLAIARSLAQLHKGTLELKPAENERNLFALALPIRQQEGLDGAPAQQPQPITK